MPAALAGEGAFAASNTSLVVGEGRQAWFGTGGPSGARVFRSRDGGRTWEAAGTPVRHTGPGTGVFSLAFLNGQEGIAVGGDYTKPEEGTDTLALTHDGGRTWERMTGQGPRGYRSVVAVRPGTGEVVAAGTLGADVSRDGGRTWQALEGPGFHCLSFARTGAGWAAGVDGRVARYGEGR